MTNDICYGSICFFPLDPTGPKLFGFAEYLAGLALMILVWTTADFRYRFRVRTAPLPLDVLSLAVIGFVGIAALLTDLWRAQSWLVPRGHLLSPAGWQAFLAGLLLLTFWTWIWFAIVRPPRFGRANARRYAETLFHIILKGSPNELPIVAMELVHSAKSLIKHASEPPFFNTESETLSETTQTANEILLLIAERRFCRTIVTSSPATAWALFDEVRTQRKLRVPIGIFGRSLMSAAFAHPESFVFQEAEGYESGLIGFHKPVTQTMFGNYEMVEAVSTLLNPEYKEAREWTPEQWNAYCRVVLMTVRDYVATGQPGHAATIYGAMQQIGNAARDLYKIDGNSNESWSDPVVERLNCAVTFANDLLKLLDESPVPKHIDDRISKNYAANLNLYGYAADLIFELIENASKVKSPRMLCWTVQHNSVWGDFFNGSRHDGTASRLIKGKVFRLLYKDIAELKTFPNFKGAPLLALCLNIMGLKWSKHEYVRDTAAFHRLLLRFVRRNFDSIYVRQPLVAEACLVEGLSYDPGERRLTKTRPAEGLQRVAHHVHFEVDKAELSETEIET